MRTPIIVAAALVFSASNTEVLAQPQTLSSERRFEVASVKPVLSPAELGRLAAQSGAGFSCRRTGLDPNSTEPLPPPLVGALQQQLGLKLEKQIGPMPIVVIDAAEHPTPD